MGNIRILILYITERSGHHKAALSIKKAILNVNEDAEVSCLDAFNYTNPILNKIAHKTYMQIIKRKPEVWEYLYDNPKVVMRTQKLKTLIHKYNSRKLINLISEYKPDVVVCTQAFPCGMIADLKRCYGIRLPLVGVLTDYVAHSFWYYEDVDLYIVPNEEAKERMVRNGILEEKVKVYGIPIDPAFAQGAEGQELLQELRLNGALPIILLMGGGRGLGPIKQVLYNLMKVGVDFQVIVICGVNRKLYNSLKAREGKFPKLVRILGYVDNIHELMRVSTLLISKPGGITTAEALASGLPMVIFNPLPGQETSNANFLLEIGAAVKCDRASDIPIIVRELLENRNKLKYMSERAKIYGRPNSSLHIAREVIRLLQGVYA